MKLLIRITNNMKRKCVVQFEPTGDIKDLSSGNFFLIELEKRGETEPFDIIINEDSIILNENNDVFATDVS